MCHAGHPVYRPVICTFLQKNVMPMLCSLKREGHAYNLRPVIGPICQKLFL